MISTDNDSACHIGVLLGRRIILSILTVVFAKHNVTQLGGYQQQQQQYLSSGMRLFISCCVSMD